VCVSCVSVICVLARERFLIVRCVCVLCFCVRIFKFCGVCSVYEGCVRE